jgi:hypothetical protein
MSSISWTSTTSGNWNTAANWGGGKVPGAADDATINTSQSITVTYSSGTDSVLSLYTGGNDSLDFTGGALSVDGDASLYGAVTQSGGTFALAGQAYFMDDGLTQTAGTVKIDSGTLTLGGSAASSLGGTISGATLLLAGGTDSITASAKISVGQLELGGADVTLAASFSQVGLFDESSGTLAIGANTLTLSGPSGLTGGVISGSGAVHLGGATEFGGIVFEGNEKVVNTGTIDQDATSYVGYNGTDSISFTNGTAGVWRIDGDQTVSANANTAVDNEGTLIKTAGTGLGYFDSSITSSGTITISSGHLQFTGANNTIGGTVNGAGTLDLAGGSTLFSSNVTLSVGGVLLDGAAVALGGILSYAGDFAQTSGTLTLGGHTLTLSGAAALDGGNIAGSGNLVLSGATEFDDGALEGSVAVTNTGTISQGNNFYIGYFGTDTVKLSNAAGGVYLLSGGVDIFGTTGSSIANAGTFAKTAASTSYIADAFGNTGTLAVSAGALVLQGSGNSFGGTVSGSGTLALNGGADSFVSGLTLTVGSVLLEAGVLTLSNSLTYTGSYAQTAGTLSLGKIEYKLSGPASLDGGVLQGAGTLEVASATSYNYVLEGSSKLLNIGTLTVTNDIYDGYNSGDTSSIINDKTTSVLLLAENAVIYGTSGASLTNAGLLDKASGAGISTIQPSVSSTGKIEVASGTLRLAGASNSIAGTIFGAGTLELNTGADSFASGISITVGNLLLDGATVNLGGALTYAGSLEQTTGTLALGGNDLTLSGPFNLTGGYVSGSGTLSTSGTTSVAGGALTGSVVLQNSGTLVQSGSWYVGYASGDTASLQNLAAGTLRIENNATLYGEGADAVDNAGNIFKTGGGLSTIQASLTNSGSITVSGGTLSVAGANNMLGGVFAGAGTVLLSAGTDAVSGATLSVAGLTLGGATVTLGAAESYAGAYAQNGGTLALGGNIFKLSGDTSLYGAVTNGSGTLALSGTTQILGGWAAEGSVVVTNTGTLTDLSNWYLGYNSTDTASLDNAAGGKVILGSATIYSEKGDTIVNAGTISKALGGTGNAYIAAAVSNTGSIAVSAGTLTFAGVVSGAGHISAGAATTLDFAASASGGTVSLGALADLVVDATAGFGDTITGFAAGDVIGLGGLAWTGTLSSFSFDSADDRLAVTNGSSSITLQLAGTYTDTSFALFSDAGVIGITHT